MKYHLFLWFEEIKLNVLFEITVFQFHLLDNPYIIFDTVDQPVTLKHNKQLTANYLTYKNQPPSSEIKFCKLKHQSTFLSGHS